MPKNLTSIALAVFVTSNGGASAAVLLNPFSLAISETAFTDNAAPPIAYSTTDTLQTAVSQSTPQATLIGSVESTFAIPGIADATSGTDFGGRYIPQNTAADNNGTEFREFTIEFNNNYTGPRQLQSITDFVFGTTNTRRFYDLTYQFSTSAAPTTFTTFAQVKDNTVASGNGTAISITGFGAAFSDVRTIKVISTEAFAGAAENQLAVHSEIDINMIPEPSAALLLGLSGAFLLIRRRK